MEEGQGEGEDANDGIVYLYRRVSRVGRMTNWCLLISLLALLILGIGAGVHSYRVFLIRNSYSGMCRLPLRDFLYENSLLRVNLKDNFELDFDIDVEEENYELMEVPDLFFGRYLHDFNENMTVIIDRMKSVCYIMPLDSQVPRPRILFDIIKNMYEGKYNINLREIKKNYRIFGPAKLEDYGGLVTRGCWDKDTYKLEEIVGDVVVKRETPQLEKYGEFTGDTIVQYHIVNMD